MPGTGAESRRGHRLASAANARLPPAARLRARKLYARGPRFANGFVTSHCLESDFAFRTLEAVHSPQLFTGRVSLFDL